MSDASRFQPAGPTPGEALRSLPLRNPPRSAWADIAMRLPAAAAPTPRRSTRMWFALAATLALALIWPVWRGSDVIAPAQTAIETATPAPDTGASNPAPASDDLDALLRESAQLEAWLAWSGSQGGESGAGASVELDIHDRIAALDALLSRPSLDPAAQLPLWQERVLRLRQLAGLYNTQQMLAANGDGGGAAPVTVF